MKNLLIGLFISFLFYPVFGQQTKVDSLKKLLPTITSQSEKYEIVATICN